MATLTYKLIASMKAPDFAAERRYILTEKEFARRQAEKRGGLLSMLSYAPLGIFKPGDWRKYMHALDHYEDRLRHHELEIQGGLIPLHIDVENHSGKADAAIKIHLVVSNGSIHPKMKAPVRPPRMDGAANAATKVHFKLPSPGGFSRSHIRIASRSVEAEFSKLEAHDSAILVNKVLYFSANDQTRLAFTVQSKNSPSPQRGFVDVLI
jgi:hypothetical protein